MINKLNKSDKAYRNISEASEELGLEAHVLRFWESRFDNLVPMVRGGKRRFYSTADMELLHKIKTLLHDEGHTIKAANRMLMEKSPMKVARVKPPSLVKKPSDIPSDTIAQLLSRLEVIIAHAKADIARINQLLN